VTRSVSLNDRWPLAPPIFATDSLPDGLVVARVTTLAKPEVVQQFDRALATLGNARGLIVDLRDATGGKREYGYDILARLTARPFPTVLRRTPEYRPGLRALGLPDSASTWYTLPLDSIVPRDDRQVYTGPIAVLSSARTSGAAEAFLAAFRNLGRGVIIGATSAGSPGEVLDVPLLKDWTLELSVTRDAFPNGTEFTGAGVAPELPVTETVDDFLAGRDPVLERARVYLTAPRN
jgi:carboxyl-terminal processing protease